MSKAIKFDEVHKLVPGVKLFHVIGVRRGNRLFNVNDITEFEIMSNVYNEPHQGIPGEVLWMDGVFTYLNYAGVLVKGGKRNASLRDGGISRDGTVYNLNRFFWNHQDAQLFLRELNCGVFSDEADQKEFNSRTYVDWVWE